MQPLLRGVVITCALAAAVTQVSADEFYIERRSSIGTRDLRPTNTRDGFRLNREFDNWGRFYNPYADLEATSIQFMVDYHWSADVWHSHRTLVRITNLTNGWSAGNRTWEIYRMDPDLGHIGISLMGQGSVPPLSPGQTHEFTLYLPSWVGTDAAYFLLLSPGDNNPGNDSAADF